MEKRWIAYYMLIAGLIIFAAGKGWLPAALLLGIIGFSIYRFFKGRDIERVTSVVLLLLCILMLVGAQSRFITGLFVLTSIVELAF